ncbi:hypothetical protein EYZ11_000016 [Aspergillus tanneri]|uniref:Uncharacterized protein n=1 Tax=Aspergillus tanneri TaxID=1220188 RepID=A0A4S3JY11_9EURO|nr:hypothetical protein EYZ11_000016 [Aspergillus tanneri]
MDRPVTSSGPPAYYTISYKFPWTIVLDTQAFLNYWTLTLPTDTDQLSPPDHLSLLASIRRYFQRLRF